MRSAMATMASSYSPESPGARFGTLEPVPGHSTLEPVFNNNEDAMEGKEVYSSVEVYPGDGVDNPTREDFMHRRVCGIRMKIALLIGGILLMFAIGAAVGGAVGSRKKGQIALPPPVPTSSLPPAPSSTSAASTTIESATGTTGTAVPTNAKEVQDYFDNDKWYTFGNRQVVPDENPYFIQMTWDDKTSSGYLNVGSDASPTSPDKQFQLRSVPRTWPNSSYSPEGWPDSALTYWISCREYGPDVLFTLDDKAWREAKEKVEAASVPIGVMRKDLSDEGQYWWFQKWVFSDGSDIYHMYNVKSGLRFKAVYHREWGNPMVASVLAADERTNEWVIESGGGVGETIGKKTGGFTWFTDNNI